MKLSLRMSIVYTVLISVLLLITLHTEPRFNYSLDDPYIHLALAQNIAHGTYGINAGETTSPSSSVVWPFLLAPFSHTVIRYWAPFLENLLFGLMLCALLGGFFSEVLGEKWNGASAGWAMATLLVLASNLTGLAFVGMEHTLQVLVCAGCGIALVRSSRGERVGPVLMLCALVAPAVRYEDAVFTAAVTAVLLLRRRYAAGLLLFVASMVPLAALSLFFHLHGLHLLPNSVMVKSGVITARPHLFPHSLALDHALVSAMINWRSLLIDPSRIPLLPLVLALCIQAYRSWQTARSSYLLVGLAAVVLTISFAPYGWFYRYDVAVRVFLLILITASLDLWHSSTARCAWTWAAPALLASVYAVALVRTPLASQAIASQQFQMHRLQHDFLRVNVAVNDLGWVACDNDGQYYVLDLLGLGSNDTQVRYRTPAWLDAITRKHDIQVAMVYGYGQVPPQWVTLGVLHHKRIPGDILPPDVQIYATMPENAAALRTRVDAFAATLPSVAWLERPRGLSVSHADTASIK